MLSLEKITRPHIPHPGSLPPPTPRKRLTLVKTPRAIHHGLAALAKLLARQAAREAFEQRPEAISNHNSKEALS